MITPGSYDEREAIARYVEEQIDALRNAAHGLSEQQAQITPCRSVLSIGGILKHVTRVASPRAVDAAATTVADFEAAAADFYASFALTDEQTLAGTLAAFDDATGALVASIRQTDPEEADVEPPAPWYGRTTAVATNRRFGLLHVIEELARHAGHADIIREQIDGATAGPLAMAVHGVPANPFAAPWEPAPAAGAAHAEGSER